MSNVGQFKAKGTLGANGTYGLASGVSGVAAVPPRAMVTSIACVAGAVDATVQIGVMPAVTVPASRSFSQDVDGGVSGAVNITFTNTVSYLVEWITLP